MKFEDFTEEMRNEIVSAAQESLLKIGVTAKVNLTFKFGENEKRDKAVLTTEKFNTTPVIYKEIYISGDARIVPLEGYEGVYDLVFYLNFWFTSFDNGRNGTELGALKFRLFDEAYHKIRFIGFTI